VRVAGSSPVVRSKESAGQSGRGSGNPSSPRAPVEIATDAD
jgi:hypothetical protein